MSHYKNGRPALNGEPVIGKQYGRVVAGTIHTISQTPGQTTCNCTVAEVVPGGVNQLTCQTVGEYYHASDAIDAIDATTATAKAEKDSAAASGEPAPQQASS